MWVYQHGHCWSNSAHTSWWRWGRETDGMHVYLLAWELLGIPSSNTYIDYLARPDGRLKQLTTVMPCSAPKECMPFISQAGILCCWDDGSGYNQRQMFYVRRRGIRRTAGAENLGCFLPAQQCFCCSSPWVVESVAVCSRAFGSWWETVYFCHSDSKVFGIF